jgi:hypothetical protein
MLVMKKKCREKSYAMFCAESACSNWWSEDKGTKFWLLQFSKKYEKIYGPWLRKGSDKASGPWNRVLTKVIPAEN